MKKLTIFFVIVLFSLSSYAQGFEAGLKAGMNTSKISTNMTDYSAQSINNYQFGAFARLNLGRLYVQPEVYYNSKGGKIEKVSTSTINEFDLKTVDVPALVGIKIINQEALNVRIMAGPEFSFLTSKSVNSQTFSESNLKNSFFGWQYGVGVDFLFLTLDIRKESFSNNLYSIPNVDFDSKKGTFIISLGVKLF